MILKAMVFRVAPDELDRLANPRKPYFISVALFRIDGEFMFGTSFPLDAFDYALSWLRDLFSDILTIEVAKKNGEWAGSRCGPCDSFGNREKERYSFARSWHGKNDRGTREASWNPDFERKKPKRLRKAR